MKNKLIAIFCILSILVSCITVFAEGEEVGADVGADVGTETDSERETTLTEEEQQQMQDAALDFETEDENKESISEILDNQLNKETSYNYDEAEALMISLGILTEDDDMSKKVTRAEFAHALYVILGYDYIASSSAVGVFSDVNAETPYYKEISLLKDYKIISGYGDGTFRPESEVNVYEASKMLIRIIYSGWGEALFERENFNYYSTALEKKLFKGIDQFNTDYITNSQLAHILLNVFKCEIDDYPIDGEKSLYMNSILNIYETNGIFLDDSRTYEKGNYIIGNMKFPKPENDYSDLLGQRVVVYYKNVDDETSILSMTPYKSQEVLDITDEDIESFSNGVYKYTRNSGSSATARLEYDYDIIYNGVRVTEVADTISLMTPDMGSVRLIDNDNDRKYEVVVIWDFKLFVVNAYSEYNYILTSQNNQKDISLNEQEDVFDILMAGTDNVLSTNQIAYSDYVLSVARSINDEYVKIYLCAETVSGAVTGVNSLDRSMTIDGKTYKYEKCMEAPAVTNGEFYIDQFGRIIYQRKVSDTSKIYAYVIKNYIDTDTDKVMIWMYTQDNQTVKSPLADKVVIDGRTINDKDNIMVALDGIVGSIVKFRMNSKQEITFIDTKNNNAAVETDGLNVCFEDTQRMGFNAACMAIADYDTGLGKCPIKLDTIVFCVMEPYTEDNIWAYNLTDFKNKYATGYSTLLGEVIVYNSDPDSYVGDVVLNKRTWMGNGFTYSTSVLRSGAIVTGVSEYVDDFGEKHYKLKVVRGSKTEEVIVKKEAMNYSDSGAINTEDDSKNIYTISKGDIIRWRLDVNGMIDKTGISVIYDCDRDTFFYESGKTSYAKGTTSESGRWNRLWLYKRDGEHLISYNADMISLDDFDKSNIDAYKNYRYVDYLRDVSTYKTEVWVYDRESNTVEKGSIADFDYYVNSGTECGEVFSFTNMMHRFFLIYR